MHPSARAFSRTLASSTRAFTTARPAAAIDPFARLGLRPEAPPPPLSETDSSLAASVASHLTIDGSKLKRSPKLDDARRKTLPPAFRLPPVQDPLLTFFTSHLLRDGKRHQAAKRVSGILNSIHQLTHARPLPILRHAVNVMSPELKVVSQKNRNKSVMVPKPLTPKQRTAQALRWIIKASDSKQDFSVEMRIAKTVIGITRGEDEVLKRKAEAHQAALTNRANASVRI